MKYSHLSEDKKTVFFKGDVTLPESEQISFTFSLDDKNIIATPNGILIPSEVTDLICEMALHTECEHIEDDIPSDGETIENEANDETNDSDNTEKRGCGSSVVGSMSVSIIIIAALAISVAKNKKKIYNQQ